MKKISSILLILTVVFFSCSKEEDPVTTTETTTTVTKTLVKITVENISGVVQPNKTVDMFDSPISTTQSSTIIMSVTTNSSGVATFDLANIATSTPKTFYFGVFEQGSLKGSKQVDGIKTGQETSSNLVLL